MTDWLLVAVRFGLYAALMALFGLAAFALYTLRGDERRTALALRPWLGASAALALLLSAALLIVMAAGMAGVDPAGVDRETIKMLATAPGVGTAFLARMAALLVALVAAWWARSAAGLGVIGAAGAVALCSLAWNGHGAMDEGAAGWAHLLADMVHLLAAGAWAGALVALILLVARPAARATPEYLVLAHRALHGFSSTGTLVMGLLVATGLVSGWLLVGPGNLAALPGSLYGRLLLAKLALFGVMLGLASANRFRLTPAFAAALYAGDARAALKALRRSLSVEAACVALILALVAWLGTLEPPASM